MRWLDFAGAGVVDAGFPCGHHFGFGCGDDHGDEKGFGFSILLRMNVSSFQTAAGCRMRGCKRTKAEW